MTIISLIPFICGAGASTAGCENGPRDLEARDLAGFLSGHGVPASWAASPAALLAGKYGAAAQKDLPPLGSEARKEIVMHHCEWLRDAVAAAVKDGALPVTLGGDHAMAAGSIAGLAKAHQAHGKIGVIWVDAHPDINTDESSYSEALHGMPIAALLGMGDKDFSTIGGDAVPVLKPEHIFYIGIRDIDPAEQRYMDRLGIRGLTNKEVVECGIEAAFAQAIEVVTKGTDHIVLSMDLDGFDPKDAPSVGTPVDGGLRLERVLPVLAELVRKVKIDMVEIAEYNPTLGSESDVETTFKSIAALLETVLLNMYGSRRPGEAGQCGAL